MNDSMRQYWNGLSARERLTVGGGVRAGTGGVEYQRHELVERQLDRMLPVVQGPTRHQPVAGRQVRPAEQADRPGRGQHAVVVPDPAVARASARCWSHSAR